MLWDIQLIMQRRIPKYISYHFGLNYLSSKFLKGAHWQPISCCSMSAVRSLRFMQVALSFLVFSRAVAEGPEGALPRHLDDGVLQKVCSRADLASVCSKTIRIPTGATMSYKDACTTNVCTWSCGQKCTNNCCTWSEKSCTNKCCCWGFLKCGCSKNKCGEVCVNVPHFGCSKPKCGETCVDIPCSGASSQHCGETCVQVPDTLHIDWKDVSPCSHFTGLGTLLQTARATCSCLGGLSDFISSHVADYQQADPSVTALQAAANMVSCLVKEGFHMQSNKESVVNSLVSGNDYIIQASPVDLDLYLTLAGAVASCAVGGACQLIVTSLTDYFKTVAEEVGTGFNSFLDTSILQSVLEPLESAAELPQVFAEALPSSLSCLADSEQAAYLQLQTSVKELAHWFQELKKDVKTLREQGLQTKEAISKAINAVSGKVTTIVEELQEGKVPLLDSVKQISDLSEVQNFFSAVSSVSSKAAEIRSKATELDSLQKSLRDLADLSQFTDCLQNLTDLSPFAEQIKDPLQKFSELELNSNSVQAGIVSYKQEFDFKLELPCSKMERWEATVMGQTVSADVPKFYKCDVSLTLPMPNEHIPYLRIKNGAKVLT